MFKLRPGEKPMYGEHPDIKKAVDYFKSLITPDEWLARREAIAREFYQSLVGNPKDPTGKGRFYNEKDLFGWYLFLAEAFTDHPENYEVFYGSRVIPIFLTIGQNLDLLKDIGGFAERAKRAITIEKAQPNGVLFEILVAGAYAKAGGDVNFRSEEPGKKKTYDFDVKLNGKNWAVECKRMEGGEYHENERMKMRELWRGASSVLVRGARNCICDLVFKTELNNVSEDYLLRKALRFDGGQKSYTAWSDPISSGSIDILKLDALQQRLRQGPILYPSPKFNLLLTGEYRRYDKLITLYSLKFARNPHFISDLDLAVVARWSSLSAIAIEKKARDIVKKLAEANEQLPNDIPGVVHIGFEAVEADAVERRRYEKIIETGAEFNRLNSQLEFIYCHYFAPESSPTEVWAIDETVQWLGTAVHGHPLSSGKVFPSNDAERNGVHWNTNAK